MKKYIRSARQYNLDRALSPSIDMRAYYAGRVRDPELHEIYAYDPSQRVKFNLACNPYISEEIMEILTREEYIGTLRFLAMHPNATPKILDILADNRDIGVRAEVVNRPNTSTDTLIKIYRTAGDEYEVSAYCKDCMNRLKEALRKRGVNYEEIH